MLPTVIFLLFNRRCNPGQLVIQTYYKLREERSPTIGLSLFLMYLRFSSKNVTFWEIRKRQAQIKCKLSYYHSQNERHQHYSKRDYAFQKVPSTIYIATYPICGEAQITKSNAFMYGTW